MNLVRFFGHVYADNRMRRQNRRRISRDLWLYATNWALRPLEQRLVARQGGTVSPVVFIVGPPRSGTTLLFQLLARYLDVGYVNNAVARYWMAPLVGLMRSRHRHGGRPVEIPLRSAFGGTTGPHAPHEFGWFWQYWCGFFDTDDLSEAELDSFNWRVLRSEIHAMAAWLGRPLVFKSLNYVVYNIDRFAREFPSSLFLYIRRDPRYVVQSILECRVERYGDERVWWTIRPRDVGAWLQREPIDQVCHQVADIRRAIEGALGRLPEKRRAVVDYEELIAAPHAHLARLASFMETSLRSAEDLKDLALPSGNVTRMDPAVFASLAGRLGL